MARLKKEILLRAYRFMLAGARKGLLPSGLVFGLAGLIASGLRADDGVPITCYAPPPIEYYGPITRSVNAFPNPTVGAKTVRVVATLVGYSEGQRVAGADLYVRTESHEEVPGAGSKPMKPVDGEFDSDSEDVYLDLNVSDWAPGSYWIHVSGYSETGEEGISYAVNLEVTPSE